MNHHLGRINDLTQRLPGVARLPTRLTTGLRRNDFGAGFTNGESVLGGLLEFRES